MEFSKSKNLLKYKEKHLESQYFCMFLDFWTNQKEISIKKALTVLGLSGLFLSF